MNIILTEDVESLGSAGDLLKVKDGFARNYLISGGKAMVATTQNVKMLKHQKQLVQSKLNKLKREAELLASKIGDISCTVAKPVGEEDKIFGAVTAADIQSSLAHEGLTIDKRIILLDEPLKSLGIFTVPIKLHPDVTAQLKVWVVKE